MQGNNKLRVFSGNTSNYIADADLDGATVQTGAVNGGVAASNLYNSLSLTTTLACTSLIDFVAQYNPSVTFGQTTPIETWITAVGNAIASKTSVDNIVNGTTTVGNANNVTTNINGNAISDIFESNGTTVKNATNSANATNVNVTNLDSGNNAVVNFQLGNGTSYDKTINNVANANTVQNVDFSSPNSAKFGDYIYFKRQLLWSGTEYSSYSPTTDTINEVGEITFSDEVPSGTLLEIWSNGRPVYVSAGQTDTTIPDTYASWTSGYVNIVFNSIKFETTTTGLTFTMKQSLIKVSTTQDTIVTSRREGAMAVSNVTKVYAIIRD